MRTPLLSPFRKTRPPSEPRIVRAGPSDNLRGTMLMVLSMAAFTCNDAVMKAVTQTLPLYESVALRGMAVLALMVAAALVQGDGLRLTVPRGDVAALVIRTAADIVSTLLYLLALRQMALADLSAIMQALPLAVTLTAALFFRERLGWRRLSAIGVGFLGVLLILRPGTGAFDTWSAVALLSMLLIVVRDIATRYFSRQVGSGTIAFHAALAVMLSGFVLGAGEDWRMPDLPEAALLANDGRRLYDLLRGSGLDADSARAYTERMREPGALTAALNWYRALPLAGRSSAGPVAVPTLYVWGERDFALGRRAAESTGDFVTGPYEFVPLPEAGHWLPERNADSLLVPLLRHLGRNAGPGRNMSEK